MITPLQYAGSTWLHLAHSNPDLELGWHISFRMIIHGQIKFTFLILLQNSCYFIGFAPGRGACVFEYTGLCRILEFEGAFFTKNSAKMETDLKEILYVYFRQEMGLLLQDRVYKNSGIEYLFHE